ncbi:MAG TPA: polysaccharide deacetylase family protein [Dongiaceae bacterium]|nr:polysaccharide deacetylase family protein [Dongiaceae bacterium]
MLICPLYHRVNKEVYSNSLEIMDAHLRHIAGHCHVVLPGEPLSGQKLNVCLTFDDAFFDFYHLVFPLLKKYSLRAVLAVPAQYILDDTAVPVDVRLSVPHEESHHDGVYQLKAPYCTWKELKEMSESGLVSIASHSYSHSAIRSDGSVDLDLELSRSKQILEEKLGITVRTFVYPYGTYDKGACQAVKRNYEFAMRIGNAVNFSWCNTTGVTYRVNADGMTDPYELFGTGNMIGYYWKLFTNIIRKK